MPSQAEPWDLFCHVSPGAQTTLFSSSMRLGICLALCFSSGAGRLLGDGLQGLILVLFPPRPPPLYLDVPTCEPCQ